MARMRSLSVAERRARLGRRHHLAADTPAPDVTTLAANLVGLHASDPSTVALAARPRVAGFVAEDLERALYAEDGTLLKHLGMRRTLFVVPVDLVPVVQGACTHAIAAAERRRLIRDVEAGGLSRDGARWLRRAERATLAALADQGDLAGAELSRAVPELRAKLVVAPGRPWGGEIAVTGRVLTILAAEGLIVRHRPSGSWTSSRHRWRVAAPRRTAAMDGAEATVELVRRWLWAFGPATFEDIVWWTGLGIGRIRAALARLPTAAVDLDGAPGLVLADDLEPVEPVAPWAALLPSLDPTIMGWKRREWYLGDDGPALFDRNGNAGPTVWWDGRVVGGWTQRPTGEVVLRLLEDAGADARQAVEARTSELQAWLGDTVVVPLFPTPLDRELRG
jgi:Winged helix DNA-binding domain